MRVADVNVNKYESGSLLGFADIIFSLSDGGNGCMTIKGFKIFKNQNGSGIQIGLPAEKKNADGKYPQYVRLDFEDEDAKAWMNHVTEEVARAYNAAPDKKPQQSTESTGASDNSGGGIGSDDIPF